VLVCDDHPVNRKLLVAMLGRLGLTPVVCVNGAEAVDQVRQAPFDLVLMDMHMPVMDGLAATRAIRALSGLSHQPVVVAVTADAFAEAHQRAQEAGMDDVITKPLQLRDIKTCLNRHFGLATV
jgi:CheY-like chemotaxis protein